MPISLHNATMRLLGLWASNCVDDAEFALKFTLSDFLAPENIRVVAERDLFPEYDPDRKHRRLMAEDARQRNLVRAWQTSSGPQQ